MPRKVRLHAGPNEAVGPAIALLGRWFDLDGVVIGGGTALEARWHHRRSTDLDLFAPLPYLSNLLRVPRDRFERELAAQAREERADASAGLGQMHTVVSGVPVSLSGTRGFWKEDHDPCVETSTGVPLAPSADILLRKMQGRVLAQGRAVPRDAYDFVVAHGVDPTSFRDAVAQLDEDQSNAIADTFDALVDEPPTREGRGVEEPTYPDVLEQGLWRLAAQVFRHPQQEVNSGREQVVDKDDRLRFAPHNQRVHPLETFDTSTASLVMKASDADVGHAKWLLLKKLAGHSCKVAWSRAEAIVSGAASADEDERVGLRAFFTELDGPEIAQVMRAAGATPRRMAALFHDLDVRQWQAVLWVNQFSSHPETPEMRYWDKFALGSLRFVDGKLQRGSGPFGWESSDAKASDQTGCSADP